MKTTLFNKHKDIINVVFSIMYPFYIILKTLLYNILGIFNSYIC